MITIFHRLYLFLLVISLSSGKLEDIFETFEIISQVQKFSRIKRSLDYSPNKIILNLPLKNRSLILILDKQLDLLSDNLSNSSTLNQIIPVKGTVKDILNSSVHGIVVDNKFRGNIFLKGNLDFSSSETLFVEPAYIYLNSSDINEFLVYPGNGLKNSKVNSLTCKSAYQSSEPVARELKEDSLLNYFKQSRPHSKYTKSGFEDSKNRVCNLFLQTDTYLWDYIMSLRHINGNKALAFQEIQSILILHVESIQLIYSNSIFESFSGRIKYHGINFRVDRMQINTTDVDCRTRKNGDINGIPDDKGSLAEDNPFCSPNIDVTNFLNLNSYMIHDDFCLSYIFTYRDFTGGTLGLAWVAQTGAIGGICEKNRPMKEAGQSKMFNKSLNTGVVTLMNYGTRVALKVSQLTFAHEIGHNFGAKHDDDHKDDYPRCLPPSNHPDGNYLMFASATSGDKKNNNKFSVCSLDSISRLVDDVINGPNNCLIKSDGPFCGNKLTEEDEECDCGFTDAECMDKCCYPSDAGDKSCHLRNFFLGSNKTPNKVQCSPNAGECCTTDCQFRDSTHLCRAESECHSSSYCTGTSVKCPQAKPAPDLTPCQNFTKVCKSGQCLGSICEYLPGWEVCTISGSPNHLSSQEYAARLCYVACQKWESRSNNNLGEKIKSALTPCITSFELERDEKTSEKYPELFQLLVKNGKGTQLAPGQPCDNHRGYCDVFRQCRPIEAQGPLARLRSLLLDVMMWKKVQNFITVYWWGMLLMSIFFIILMILFVKIFGYSHPAASIPINRMISLSIVENTQLPPNIGKKKRRRMMQRMESEDPSITATNVTFSSKKSQKNLENISSRLILPQDNNNSHVSNQIMEDQPRQIVPPVKRNKHRRKQ